MFYFSASFHTHFLHLAFALLICSFANWFSQSVVHTHQDQEHGAVAQQGQDGHHPDDDPQRLRGHDVLAGVEVVGCRRAGHSGGLGAVLLVEVGVGGGLGVEAQLTLWPDTYDGAVRLETSSRVHNKVTPPALSSRCPILTWESATICEMSTELLATGRFMQTFTVILLWKVFKTGFQKW